MGFLRFFLFGLLLVNLSSCYEVIKVVLLPPAPEEKVPASNSSTTAAFWGLPGITFENWRPNIHIKASTNNGALAGRVWEGNPDLDPDTWSLFEYSQILYYDSDYISGNYQSDQVITVDNNTIMPLAFEQKLYKKVGPMATEAPKNDVTWNSGDNTVVIQLDTVNSNYLTLMTGARIAVMATQRPSQWGASQDYTIIDAIPGDHSLQKSPLRSTLLASGTDRLETRTLGYLTYTGGTLTASGAPGDWFEKIEVTNTKIVLTMPHLATGDAAKAYWDSVDQVPVAPFMLFWIAIQQ